MRYDIKQDILDLSNKPMAGLFGPQDKLNISYLRLFVLVASNGLQNDSAEEKYKSFQIGLKMTAASQADGIVDLTDVETVRLKALVGTNFSPIIYGRVVDFLASPLAKTQPPIGAAAGMLDT